MKFKKDEFLESKAFKFAQKYWLYIVVVIALIIVAISSVNIYKEEVLELDPTLKYEDQGTISFAAASFDTLNPLVSKSEDTYYLSKLMYSSLFEYTDNLNVAGDLVENYTVDTEKAFVDLKLKAGITWHDGKAFTTSDVRFTVNVIKAQGSSGLYYENAAKIHSVSVKDDLNVRIYFNNNYNCSLDDLTFPIVQGNKTSSVGTFIRDIENFKPVGTGQYKFDSYDSFKEVKLTPNDSYYGAKATNRISVKILPSKGTASSMLEIGSVTCYTEKGSERKSLVNDKELKMYDIVSNEVDFIVFNTSRPHVKNKIVRRGLCYAIDNENILQDGYMEDGILTDTIYYPNFLGIADKNSSYNFDREKAKETLASVGYEDKNRNGKIQKDNEKEIALTILVNSNNANRLAAARIMSKNLESIGFTININSVPWEEYNTLIAQRNFDILITGYEMDAAYDLRQFFDGTNPWGYMDNEMLQEARDLDRLHTAAEYTNIYDELKELMIEKVPYYPLCYKKMGLIGVDTFEAKQLPMFNDIYKNCQTWSWQKKIPLKEETK